MDTSDSGHIPLHGWTFGNSARCCNPLEGSEPAAAQGSRRRRLWELGPHAHCPVIGVCLPLAAMRRLVRKVLGGEPVADAYDLHCGMVADCTRRSRMAEAVQRELDRRFMLPLRRASAVKTAEGLRDWWREQGASKDLPGALWATLTHPRCTPALENHVLGQVHMVQHQVGMATRVELVRFDTLIDDNAMLTRQLAGAQQRNTHQAAEHVERCDALLAELMRLRGELMAAQSSVAALREDLQAVHEKVPELASRLALAERNVQQASHLLELQRNLQQARSEIERLRGRREAAPATPAAVAGPPTADRTAEVTSAAAASLANRAVLCVGGRTASVPVYRRLVEDHGGRFLHHDGGEEQGAGQLESTLAAADMVICQAGCVSHNAYWRVKDHCKRTGKRCVFVETPSASSLQRVLAEIGPES